MPDSERQILDFALLDFGLALSVVTDLLVTVFHLEKGTFILPPYVGTVHLFVFT